MPETKASLGQKNFALGEGKKAFEAWCRRNGYEEKRAFLAGLLALQRLSLSDRAAVMALVDKWIETGFKTDQDHVATVVAKPSSNPSRPADSPTESRPASRRAG